MSVSDVVPILSDADPPITYEPSAPAAPDNSVIKVSLEVICCPCPRDDCTKPDCKRDGSGDQCCECDKGCCADQGCEKCEKEEEANPNFCRRWFPYLSHFCC